MLTAIPVACKLCGTCAFWGGSREILRNGFIEIHPYSKGKCQGDGFRYMGMAALATCNGWKPWPPFNNDPLTRTKVPNIEVSTRLNPTGKQEFNGVGEHVLKSGATAK